MSAATRALYAPAAVGSRRSQFSRAGQLSAAPASTRRPVRSVLTRAGDDKKEEKKISSDKVKVNFAIKLKGNYGDQVCVVGNTSKLGRWKGQDGVYLKWSEGDVWKGSVEMNYGEYVEYKVLIKDKHGKIHWEKHHNRTVQLYDGGAELTIAGRFGGSLNITKKDAKKNMSRWRSRSTPR